MNIVSAEDIKHGNNTYLIYGAPGMGKTTTTKFIPGKKLVIDVDRTSHVLKGEKDIDIVKLSNTETWEDWQKLVLDLTTNYKGKYDAIIIDNVSELERCILANLGRIGKNGGVPAQGDYQKMQFRIVDSIRYLKNMDCNLVILAWEMTEKWEENGQAWNRAYPQVNAKIINNLCGLCDVVARLSINSKGERGLYLTPTPSVYAKNQLDSRQGCGQHELFATVSE